MKVLLIQNVAGLGKIDELKDVSDGYARNFLFARNLAVPASKHVLDDLRARQAKKLKDGEKELREQQSLADRLEGYELVIKEKAGEGGSLYASVGPQKVADALVKAGYIITKNQINMKPIKEHGEYQAKIKLGHGLEAKISIIVN